MKLAITAEELASSSSAIRHLVAAQPNVALAHSPTELIDTIRSIVSIALREGDLAGIPAGIGVSGTSDSVRVTHTVADGIFTVSRSVSVDDRYVTDALHTAARALIDIPGYRYSPICAYAELANMWIDEILAPAVSQLFAAAAHH